MLLISCLNLANMMLAFGATRQKEIAIRLAVGSSRYRIVRQLLVQGMALALAGGLTGLIAASWASTALVAGMSTVLPFAITFDVSTDSRVVLATFTFCTLATIGSGLWPALRLTRPDLASSMKDQAGEISGHIAGRITVRVANGWLSLDGEVDWQYQREAAERCVRHLTGVRGVSNLITLAARPTPTT